MCQHCKPNPLQLNAKKARSKLTPLRADPSQTGALRRQFMVEVARRVRAFKAELRKWLVDDDELGLKPAENPLRANARRYEFLTRDKKLDEFNKWLDSNIQTGFLSIGPNQTPWTAKYVESAYKKGLLRAYTQANKEDLAASLPFYQGSQAQFLNSAFNSPEAVSKLRLLGTRAFENMKGFTAQMKTELSRVLADGMANGRGVRAVARQMYQSIDGITLKRAFTIARTEIIHAHAEGQLDGFDELGVEEVGIMAEWSTAGDDRVCPICSELEGVVLKVSEARGLIPRHPNCRCTWIPAGVGEESKGQKKTASAIRKAFGRSLKKETGQKTAAKARDASRWTGADRNISKSRNPES